VTWLFAVVAVAVMGVAAVVATGRGGSMTQALPDRPDVVLAGEGPLTGEELREVRFTTAIRGYRMEEVDKLLERLAAQLEQHPPR
jgi:DivIVA domain-containing protein